MLDYFEIGRYKIKFDFFAFKIAREVKQIDHLLKEKYFRKSIHDKRILFLI